MDKLKRQHRETEKLAKKVLKEGLKWPSPKGTVFLRTLKKDEWFHLPGFPEEESAQVIAHAPNDSRTAIRWVTGEKEYISTMTDVIKMGKEPKMVTQKKAVKRTGAIAQVRALIVANPKANVKELRELGAKKNLNPGTITTQFYRIRKEAKDGKSTTKKS